MLLYESLDFFEWIKLVFFKMRTMTQILKICRKQQPDKKSEKSLKSCLKWKTRVKWFQSDHILQKLEKGKNTFSLFKFDSITKPAHNLSATLASLKANHAFDNIICDKKSWYSYCWLTSWLQRLYKILFNIFIITELVKEIISICALIFFAAVLFTQSNKKNPY